MSGDATFRIVISSGEVSVTLTVWELPVSDCEAELELPEVFVLLFVFVLLLDWDWDCSCPDSTPIFEVMLLAASPPQLPLHPSSSFLLA